MKANFSLVIIFLLVFVGCKKESDPPPDPNTRFAATLNGASVVPPVTTSASGTATAVYNSDTRILSISINYTGMTVTSGFVHKGSVTQNGSTVFPLTITPSPIIYTSTGMSDERVNDLMAGNYYISLRSSAYPFGEIRGQLLKQ